MRNWVIVGILTLYGLLLRLYGLDALSIWLDEAITILAAKSTLAHGIPLLPSGWLYTSGLVQSYVLAFIGLFSWSEFWMRLPSVLVGTALIPLTYYVVSSVWNKRVGLAMSFFMAFNYWQIAWSRQARMYIFLELFFVLGLFFIYEFVTHRKPRDGVFALLFTVLAVTTHSFGAFLVLIFVIGWFSCNKTLRLPGSALYQVAYAVAGALVAWYTVRTAFGLEYTMSYLMYYVSWLRVEYLAMALLALLALFVGRKERFVLSMVVVYVVVISFFMPIFAYRYLFVISPLLAVLAFSFLDWQFRHDWMYFAFALVLLLVTSPLLMPMLNVYLEPDTPQPPWREVYDYVREVKANDDSLVVIDATPVIADYYGVRADGWLRNSLDGRAKFDTTDYYLGTPEQFGNGLYVFDERASKSVDITFLNECEFEEFGTEKWRRAKVCKVLTIQ
jgi:uncharacterized membrane protein